MSDNTVGLVIGLAGVYLIMNGDWTGLAFVAAAIVVMLESRK